MPSPSTFSANRYFSTFCDAGRELPPEPLLRLFFELRDRPFDRDLDFCAAISDQNFGKPVFSNVIDQAILGGWGIRPTDWQFGASVQQEILPRVSIEAGYFRRWFQNFFVQENRVLGTADYTQFTITAPADPRMRPAIVHVKAGLASDQNTLAPVAPIASRIAI